MSCCWIYPVNCLHFPITASLFFLFIVSGNGCGHTVLGTESGTLASPNYPGTYPSNTWCKWRLRVPERRTLRLLFGDFDIESSPGCSNGSLVITDKNGEPSLGKLVHRRRTSGLITVSGTLTEVLSWLVCRFFSEIPADRLFMLHVITDVLPDMIVENAQGMPFHWHIVGRGKPSFTTEIFTSSNQVYQA